MAEHTLTTFINYQASLVFTKIEFHINIIVSHIIKYLLEMHEAVNYAWAGV